MMRAWVVTYYENTRTVQMKERTRYYGTELTEDEVHRKATNFIRNLQRKGICVYPNYDLQPNQLIA